MKSQVQSHLDTIADGIQLMWIFLFYFLGIIHQSIIIIVIVHHILVTLLVLGREHIDL